MSWYSSSPVNFLNGGGIYQWRIDGIAVYTGQARDLHRRLRDYERNIDRIDRRESYRPANPDGFREIHRRLYGAIERGLHIEFRIVEYCDAELLNERERHHQALMPILSPPDLTAESSLQNAIDRIVYAVKDGEIPPGDAVEFWMRGGAAFWDEEHYFIAWGLHLPEALDIEMVKQLGIKEAIASSDDLARRKFGSIPLHGNRGGSVIAVSAHNGFTGDLLYGFYPDEEEFRRDVDAKGWLLGDERSLADTVNMLSDEQLFRLFRSALVEEEAELREPLDIGLGAPKRKRAVLLIVTEWPSGTMAIKFGKAMERALCSSRDDVKLIQMGPERIFRAETSVTEAAFRTALSKCDVSCGGRVIFVEM